MQTRTFPLAALAAAATLAVGGAASADVVTDWNEVAVDAVRAHRTNPPVATRNFAIVHTAVYDAVNGIEGSHQPYLVDAEGPAGASLEAAAAAAAHHALAALYPAARAAFDAELAAHLQAIPDGPAEDDGVAWGRLCAEAILAARAADGATTIYPYSAPGGAGWWVPTGPAFAPALLPNWPYVLPWAMTSGDQFRVPAPPPPTSEQYRIDFEEVKRLGEKNSTQRTADQSQIALFWNDGPGTGTPPGHWQWIARVVAAQQGTSLVENARLFALLSIVQADAAITSWDNKYFYHNWRPATGIQKANTDGNPRTQKVNGWESFITTPPFPSYTSGHSTFSGGSGRLLARFFGTDDLAFQVGSDGVAGVQRSYASLSQAAEEAGQSRIYGGIHWQYDNVYGLSSGRSLADHAFFTKLRPRRAAGGVCVPDGQTLCLAGDRFEVTARFRTADGQNGMAQAMPYGASSGGFSFFDADNLEATVKVLDACDTNDHFWVFASGMTNVEVQITVADTWTGDVKEIFNPNGRTFQAVLDTEAFATCP